MTSDKSVFHELDAMNQVTPLHWKIVLVSGMGFFTDAYDLFIIGVVLTLLVPAWHLSPGDVALLGSSSLLAAALGALIFGRIADLFGRKRIYGFEVLVLAAGAIASAVAPNLWSLILCRFILGIGIGGDYPVSATIMSEFAGTSVRGLLISLVFAMQGIGLIAATLIALVLLQTGISHDLAWRLMLGFGAIPGLSVYYMRRHIGETPRFEALAEKAKSEAPPPGDRLWRELAVYRHDPRMLRWLIGASAAWFLLDIAYYGNTLSSPLVVHAINPHASITENLEISLGIFAVAALPGYLVAAVLMDRLGRKAMQIGGFIAMAIAFGGIALLPAGPGRVMPFVILYGLSYFFAEFGPNTTTFVYPAEIFPARIRTTSHGITAMSGKLGAFVGTFAFPLVMARSGLAGAMWIVAVTAICGFLVTLFLLPEPKGQSLEEISRDDLAQQPKGAHRNEEPALAR